MKLIMESWRKYLSEEELDDPAQTNSKIIFMAGAPGSGKSTVLEGLGLPIDIVNADTFYEKYLSGLSKRSLAFKSYGKDVDSLLQDFNAVRDELKQFLGIDPEEKISHEELVQKYDDSEEKDDNLFFWYKKYRQMASIRAKKFAKAQRKAKKQKEEYELEGRPFIVDGTSGVFARMKNAKKKLEDLGYDVGMIYVDVPEDLAIRRQQFRDRKLSPQDVSNSWAAVNKNKEPYKKLFGDNFFYFVNDVDLNPDDYSSKQEFDKAVLTKVKEKVNPKLLPQVSIFFSGQELNEADWQKWVETNYDEQIAAYTRGGGNKTKPSGWKPAPISYRGAPPGASGG